MGNRCNVERCVDININKRYRINADIMTGEKLSSIQLLPWTSFIGQLVHPVEGDVNQMMYSDGRIE